MVNLFAPPSFISIYAYCIDDSMPKFKPENWIKKNRLYRLKYFCESLNTDGLAVTLTDSTGEEIHPSDSMNSFRSDRFEFFQIVLN